MTRRWLHLSVFAGLSLTGRLVAQGKEGVHVCVGPDRTIRYEPADQCPPAQRGHRLAEVKDEIATPEEEKGTEKEITGLKKTVETMSSRIKGLEKELSNRGEQTESPGVAGRVVAPFQVVDKAGKPILIVNDQRLDESTSGRVTIAPGSSGGYVVYMRTAAGQMISILGEGPDGSGVLRLIGEKGQLVAHGGDGFLLMTPSGTEAGALAFSGGAGALQLSNAKGQMMVEAGTVPAGIGVVRVGPNFACTGSPLPMGLGAPSCIMGMRAK